MTNRFVILFLFILLALHSIAAYGAAAPSLNEKAPDFALPDLGGAIHTLGDYRGKVVVLNFWATWCPDCIAEMPSLERLFEVMKNQDLMVLGISIDRDRNEVTRRNKISYPVLLDEKGDVFVKKYTITRLPVTIVVNRSGLIVEKLAGPQDFGSEAFIGKIKKYLQEKEAR